MKTVTVQASSRYQVIIGSGIIEQLGKFVAETSGLCKVALIGDSNVWPIYGKKAINSLHNNGFTCIHYVFPAGEENKSAETYLNILNFLAENNITRSDLIIALGGGVTGDITGFVAATYLRGIDYIQIPTTLLAMVDSSVGGKTAIDLPAGKNLVGAFYQPKLVLCDTSILSTLPKDIFRDGCAEVIKYGILYDPDLFSHLSEFGFNFDKEYVISRCIELKAQVVADDEFDRGARQKLNLGHTIGHAIELESNYTLSHGEAVAIGIAVVSKASAAYGRCDTEVSTKIKEILQHFNLPTNCHYTAAQLYSATLSDKKRFGDYLNLIIPNRIGDCSIWPIQISDLKSFIKAGL